MAWMRAGWPRRSMRGRRSAVVGCAPDRALPVFGRRHPHVLLSLATLFWAGNFVLGRAVRGHVPPVGLAFWRWAVALLLLVALSWRGIVAQWRLLANRWRVVLLLGILGVGNFNVFVYIGLRETEATNALLLNAACPA